jgi:hypothetical protein
MPMFQVYNTMKEFNDMRKAEDQMLQEWERHIKIRKCSCGDNYSYGYYPVEDDPGACQSCRGAEGELIL